MTNFKAGDRVRCVNTNAVLSELKVGEVYTIKKVQPYGYGSDAAIHLDGAGSNASGYLPFRFELVDPEQEKSSALQALTQAVQAAREAGLTVVCTVERMLTENL